MSWRPEEKDFDLLMGEIHSKWDRLSDDDLESISGDLDILVDKLQERYRCTRAQAEAQVEVFLTSSSPPGDSGLGEEWDEATLAALAGDSTTGDEQFV